MRQRLGVLVGAILLMLFWRFCGGAPGHLVQVDFSIDPELFFGAEVVIDGEVVGSLQPSGARNLTGFRVEEGEHTVEIRLDGYLTEPTRFVAGFGGAGRFTADLEPRALEGTPRNVLVLRR
jgi:hypothetical protein